MYQKLQKNTFNLQFFFFQRQSNRSSERETQHTQTTQSSKSNPYQSQLYDSWRTEWNVPYYDQYRSGPSGASSSAEAVNHSGGNRSAYMTKGGRRLSYEDDFWYKWNFRFLAAGQSPRQLLFPYLFRELFPLPPQKSIQCKSSKTKKNSWNNNHISVIFFDKKNNGNLNYD